MAEIICMPRLVCVVFWSCLWLASSRAGQVLVYQYTDDFSQDRAMEHALIHSIFWVKGAYPASQPHLVYWQYTKDKRGLLFRDHQGQPARLGYAIPVEPDRCIGARPVLVVVKVQVRLFNSNSPEGRGPGYLLYMVSVDGRTWSIPKAITDGRSELTLGSLAENRYLVFLGANVVMEDLAIELYMHTPDIVVPDDASTIQAAIDSAQDGQIILVRDGKYRGPGNTDIRFRGKPIWLISQNGPDFCQIDCQSKGRGFIFDSQESARSVLDGFTIVNGLGPKGGGIYCVNSSPTISNCVVRNCWAIDGTDQGRGGGIYIESGGPQILDCLIHQNWAASVAGAFGGSGGGIFIKGDCGAVIERSTLVSNGAVAGESAQNRGGAICLEGSGGPMGKSVTIRNCIFYNNSAGSMGGAIAAINAAPVVVNCTITGNGADMAGGGIYLAGPGQGQMLVKNSIIWANRPNQIAVQDQAIMGISVSYCDVQGGWLGEGNIDADPLFARPFDSDLGDAHLLSFAGRWDPIKQAWVNDPLTSPCIDAGDPKDQPGPEPTPNGDRIDMGGYGGTVQASKGAGPLVFHVSKNGSDLHTGLNPGPALDKALATIQRAVDLSRDGDSILIWPGIYKEEVDFKGKAILVQSAADPAIVTASSGAYAFSFYHQEGRNSQLRNLIIKDSPEGGVFCHGTGPTLANLTIVGCGTGIAAFEGAEPLISNCIIWYNTKADLLDCRASYSCIQRAEQASGTGNITLEPMFVDLQKGDLHLLSRYGRYWPQYNVWVVDDRTSPCIDAGDPAIYPVEEPDYNGRRIDMGAHGGTGYASLSPPVVMADLNQDGIVDMRDLAILAQYWLVQPF